MQREGDLVDAENEILQRLTRVETKLDMQLNAKDIAVEALDKAKSAQHRLDRIDKIHFWFGTTFFGAIIIGAVAFLLKGGLVK